MMSQNSVGNGFEAGIPLKTPEEFEDEPEDGDSEAQTNEEIPCRENSDPETKPAPAQRPARQASSSNSLGSLRPPTSPSRSEDGGKRQADTSDDRKPGRAPGRAPGGKTATTADAAGMPRKVPPTPQQAGNPATQKSAPNSRGQPGAFPSDRKKKMPPTQERAAPGPMKQRPLQEQHPGGPSGKRPPQQRPSGASPGAGLQKQPTREKNKLFQDVERTGKWGAITKKEIYAVLVLLFSVLAAVGVGVFFFVNRDTGDFATTEPIPSPPTFAPTVQPEVEAEDQLVALLRILGSNQFTNTTQYNTSADFYTNLHSDPSATPRDRAISWLLFQDPADLQPDNPWLQYRYALVVIYHTLGGDQWESTSGWLTRSHVCEWYGVRCDRFNKEMKEIDLASNNLEGIVPPEINLLRSVFSIVLSGNKLYGEPPQLAIGSLPRLTILFLNNNNFNGSITVDFRANGILDTFMVQINDFSGNWPREFCPRSGQPHVFGDFGLDCEKVRKCRCCKPLNPGNPDCDVEKYSNICY